MARYVDANELYKETEKKIKEANSYRMAVVDGEFLDIINDAETADVVPRAMIAEIFGEIEKIIEKSKYQQATPFGTEERYNPYVIVKQVADLKKKYTGEE